MHPGCIPGCGWSVFVHINIICKAAPLLRCFPAECVVTVAPPFVSGESYKVEVKEPPQGITPPTQNGKQKVGHQPNKVEI